VAAGRLTRGLTAQNGSDAPPAQSSAPVTPAVAQETDLTYSDPVLAADSGSVYRMENSGEPVPAVPGTGYAGGSTVSTESDPSGSYDSGDPYGPGNTYRSGRP
jgi:hypothetical protein